MVSIKTKVFFLLSIIELTFMNFYFNTEYLGKAEIGLHFLEHYGGNETDKIKLQLKDVAPGRPFGSISLYLNYKAF